MYQADTNDNSLIPTFPDVTVTSSALRRQIPFVTPFAIFQAPLSFIRIEQLSVTQVVFQMIDQYSPKIVKPHNQCSKRARITRSWVLHRRLHQRLDGTKIRMAPLLEYNLKSENFPQCKRLAPSTSIFIFLYCITGVIETFGGFS